jgi:hypothetical protein
MKLKRAYRLIFVATLLSVFFLLSGPASAGMDMKHAQGAGHDMSMHHQHIMLNHALGMALEGSNLLMLGQMGMAKGVMSMHHQHIMLNHALGMALEGSNLLMLGQMGMAKGVDEISIEHGKMMMKNGRNLLNETMSGD